MWYAAVKDPACPRIAHSDPSAGAQRRRALQAMNHPRHAGACRLPLDKSGTNRRIEFLRYICRHAHQGWLTALAHNVSSAFLWTAEHGPSDAKAPYASTRPTHTHTGPGSLPVSR